MPKGRPTIPVDFDAVYHSDKYGNYRIIRDLGIVIPEGRTAKRRLVEIEFENTKYKYVTQMDRAIEGSVRDPYAKIVAGEGYRGEINLPESAYIKEYRIWNSMIQKCYDPSYRFYSNYGGLGVTVYEPWKCFKTFYESLPCIEGYQYFLKDATTYQFDELIKQYHLPRYMHIYSPETCVFAHESKIVAFRSAYRVKTEGNKYIGVFYYPLRNEYRAMICRDNCNYIIGRFKDSVVAANAYNYYIVNAGPGLPINENIPIIPLEEVMRQNLSPNEICRIVEK